ncbi:MAG: hypothetical protein JXA82_12740 [Sedimentisphaerales bacterium]|nr:hypothetical protein [Sedimentisphaerales bacterium]
MKKLILVMMLCLGLAAVAPALAGTVTYERWTGYPSGAELGTVGTDPDGITTANATWLAANAPVVQQINVFQMDEPSLDNYSGRIWGWIVPPSDGDYTFWLASDDDSRLWISSNDDPANKAMICYIDGWCGWDQFDDVPDPATITAVRPATRSLIGGHPYYMEMRWADGTGGGFGRVNWEGPIGSRQDITEAYLQNVPWGAINPNPADGATEVGLGVQTLSWEAAQPLGDFIQEYVVYFGESPDIDPNNPLGTVTETSIDTPELVNNTTYYWMVRSIVDEANYVDGIVWSFDTEDWGPKIDQQPADNFLAPACTTVLSIVASNNNAEHPSEITYTWYKVDAGGDVEYGTGDTLVTGETGDYYCVVANDENSVTSDTAEVTVGTHLVISQDVGTPEPGDAYYDEGTDQLVVIGNGADIWDAADAFHFAYKEVSGHVDISTRVISYTGGDNAWRKFGVMVRDDLTAGSPHVFMAGTATEGWAFQGRVNRDSGTGQHNVNSGDDWTTEATPYGRQQFWVRVVRTADNQLTGYYSFDGQDWIQYGSQSYTLTDPVYVGIAVTSHQAGTLTTARFSDIMLNGEDFTALPWNVANVTTNADPATDWVDYDGDAVISWELGEYTPCDSEYNVWITDNADLTSDPNIGDVLDPIATSDMTVTLADAEYGFEHDQTWYYRIDVVSEAGGGSQMGQWMSFDTIKWVPVITVEPVVQNVVDAPTDLTLACQVETVADGFADLTGFVWKRIVGDKDGDAAGDDDIIYTGTPINLGDNGKRNWDCSVTLSIEEVGNEGYYYCVVTNDSGTDVSSSALVRTKRLMVHYSFESIVEGTVVDSSPSGINGTLTSIGTGEPVIGGIVEGIIGNAIDLVGRNEPNAAYVATAAKALDLGIMGNFARSFSVWVNPRLNFRSGVYSLGEYSSMKSCALKTDDNGSANPHSWAVDHWGGNYGWTTLPSYNTWNHIVHIYDGANIQVWVNGEMLTQYATDLNTSSGENAQPLAVGYFGNYDSGYQNGVFNGMIDEFRLYNYPLSPLEIGQLYIEGAGGTACVVHPSMDLNGDCEVNLLDFAMFAEGFAQSTIFTP